MKRIVMILFLLPLAACEPMAPAQPPPVVTPSQASYLPGTTVRPENEPTNSAVDAAMMWAERYNAAITERDAALDQARRAEHGHAEADKKVLELQRALEQSLRELADANKTLLVLQADLDKWKSDVLGFRAEIRDAMAAELDALRQIMKVLGGELADSPATEPDDESDEDQP